MVVLAAWYLTNFFRRDEDPPRSREPSGNIQDYLTTALLDPRWRAHKTSMRRSVETVLRAGAKDERVVATLWVRHSTVLLSTRETIILDTADAIIELEAAPGIVWPWQLDPPRTWEVTFDGERLGTLVTGPTDVVARDAAGDVGRWQTGEIPFMPYEGKAPIQGALIGKVGGSLRVPARRLGEPRDFIDQPFFSSPEGDERWLLAFLALAAAKSLLIVAR
jgi:hypothetical protein